MPPRLAFATVVTKDAIRYWKSCWKERSRIETLGQFVYGVIEGNTRRRKTLESDELEQERNTYRYASLNTAEGMLGKSGLNMLMRFMLLTELR